MRPRRKPSPQAVAQACIASAWRDDVDDESRLLLEQAHDTIHELMARQLATSKILEVVEAEMAARRYPLLEDEDDPGMGL
jgi:hypothetical protein